MRLGIACLVLALQLLAAPLWAAGPYGGDTLSIGLRNATGAETDRLRWLTTSHGIYKYSSDKWKRLKGLDLLKVLDLVETGGRLIALVDEVGVFVSEDGGKSWTQSVEGLKSRYGHKVTGVSVLALDRADQATLLLGTKGRGLFKSVDGAKSWKRFGKGMDDFSPAARNITAIQTFRQGGVMLLGTAGSGLLKYEGEAFTVVEGKLPPKLYVTDLDVDPNDEGRLALTTKNHGLWESTDGGENWKRLWMGKYRLASKVSIGWDSAIAANFSGDGVYVYRDGKGGRPSSLGYAPVTGLERRKPQGWFVTFLHDGLFELDEAGKLGSELNHGLDATSVSTFAKAKQQGAIWCGDSNGIYYSPDAGRTWERRDKGLIAGIISGLIWKGEELYAGSMGQGLFYWNPETGSWEDRGRGMGTANTVYSLNVTKSGTIYAGTEGGVLWTLDGGKKWVRAAKPLPYSPFWSVALDPDDEKSLWAASHQGLYISRDGGDNWVLERDGRYSEVANLSGELWLRDDALLQRFSGDEMSFSLPAPEGERITTFLPLETGVLVGTNRGLWMSDFEGAASKLWDGAGVLSLHMEDDGRLFVGSRGKGVKVFKTK